MDPITHITAGALAGQAARKWFTGKAVLLFSIVAALAPDVDNFIGGSNPELYLLHHRGITHSFVGGAGLAALLALIFRPLLRERPLWIVSLIGFGGILGHIFLDLITSYGTQILLPFSNQRYTLQSVFIIDPFFTLLLLTLLGLSFLKSRQRRMFSLIGLCVIILYPLITLSVRAGLSSFLETKLSREGVRYERLHLSPEFLTPYHWKVIVEGGDSYRLADVSLSGVTGHLDFREFRKADPVLMERFGQQASMFRTYRWFSMYPVMENHDSEQGKRITFADLRFYSTLPFTRDVWRKGRLPFLLTAVTDSTGKLLRLEYTRPRGTTFTRDFN